MTFWVRARWDSEAGIFRSESNIIGLHLEATTLDGFQEIMVGLVPELIEANHGGHIHCTHKKESIYPVWNYEYGQQLLHTANDILKSAEIREKV